MAAAHPRPFHDALSLGPVELTVADHERVAAFYADVLGLREEAGEAHGLTRLSAGGPALVHLRGDPSAPPPPRGATGLFHTAFLVPTRDDLSAVLRRLVGAGVPVGSADHLASEAIYASDPEGNGIEVYRDRPADDWPRQPDGRPRIATLPLDPELLDLASAEAGLPEGTIVGHVHLKVDDLAPAVAFYRDALGLDVMASLPGAAFLGADGYHHHIGLNTWQSAGGKPAPLGSRGLSGLVIRRAGVDPAELAAPEGTRITIAA